MPVNNRPPGWEKIVAKVLNDSLTVEDMEMLAEETKGMKVKIKGLPSGGTIEYFRDGTISINFDRE